jgi:hypothetical protein
MGETDTRMEYEGKGLKFLKKINDCQNSELNGLKLGTLPGVYSVAPCVPEGASSEKNNGTHIECLRRSETC